MSRDRKRAAPVLLVLGLIVALGAAVAGAFALVRSRRPRLVVHVTVASFAAPSFAADGRLLVGAATRWPTTGELWTLDGAPAGRFDLGRTQHEAAAPESDLLAFVPGDDAAVNSGAVTLLALESGARRTLETGAPICGIGLSARGELLGVAHADGTVDVRRASDGALVRRLEPGMRPPPPEAAWDFPVVFSRDGQRVAVDFDSEAWRDENRGLSCFVFSLADGRAQRFPAGAHSFSSQGELVSVHTQEVAPDLFRIHSLATGALRLERDVTDREGVIVVGESVCVFGPAKGGEPRIEVRSLDTLDVLARIPARADVLAVALSPAEDRLAVSYQDGSIEVWDLAR